MANDLDNPGVLVLDTAAVISATNKFKIRKLFLDPAGAAASADIADGAGNHLHYLNCPANQGREIDFGEKCFWQVGFELVSITAGAHLHVYAG